MVLPVGRDSAGRPGYRLVERVVLRWCQDGPFEELVGAVVPKPVLAWFKASDDGVLLRLGVTGGVLAGRVVAATDVTALSATTQVQPPTACLEALNTAGAAGWYARDNG